MPLYLLDRSKSSMTSVDNQVRTRCKTASLAEKKDDWSSEFVGRGESMEHGSTEPLFLKVGTGGQEFVGHGCPNVARGEGLCDL